MTHCASEGHLNRSMYDMVRNKGARTIRRLLVAMASVSLRGMARNRGVMGDL